MNVPEEVPGSASIVRVARAPPGSRTRRELRLDAPRRLHGCAAVGFFSGRGAKYPDALPLTCRASARVTTSPSCGGHAPSGGDAMPVISADRLTHIGSALLRAAGASQEEADAVAVGCINANLAGHDSHGIIAIPTYIDRIKV